MLEKNKGHLINLPKFTSKEGTGVFMNTTLTSTRTKQSTNNKDISMQKGYNDLTSLSTSKMTPRATQNGYAPSQIKSARLGLKAILEKDGQLWGSNTPRINLKGNQPLETKDYVPTPQLSMRENSDYASLLMYVPDNIQSLSTKSSSSKAAFNSFTELARTTRNNDVRLFEGLIRKNAFLQENEEQVHPVDRIEMMKKVLDFNQKQKVQYVQQIKAETKNIVLPFVKQIKSRNKQKVNVKVLPSKRLNGENATTADGASPKHQDEILQFGFSGFSSPNSPVDLNRRRSSRRNSKGRKSISSNIFDDQTFSMNYKVFWNNNSSNGSGWRPNVREGHTLTTIGKYLYLYGGLSNVLNNQITIFDPGISCLIKIPFSIKNTLNSPPCINNLSLVTNTWTRPNVTGETPIYGRHGHTACEYNRTLVIFGGEQQFNKTLRLRECLNDVQMFIPETKEWRFIKTQNHLVPARRYHTAAVYERFMYIYGGISNEGGYMRDIWALNLSKFLCNDFKSF